MVDRRVIAAALALSASLSTCARSRTVALSYGPPSSYSGLDCVEDASTRTPLVSRAIANGAATFVVDFFEVPANINATGEVLLRACRNGRCVPMAARRSAIEVTAADLSLGPNPTAQEVARAVSVSLSGVAVTENAPDDTVVLRVVATTQRAAELRTLDSRGRYPDFSTAQLVGCSITPPVKFDTTESPVYLSIPLFSDPCTLTDVARCAGAQ